MSAPHPHKVTPDPGRGACLLCGSTDEPTREHIIPQALWRRFGIDPDRDDLAAFWTTLCKPHNQATSSLHNRVDLLSLIETGEPITKKTLTQLGDWAVWTTLLLGLERGSGVLGAEESRRLLLRRFDDGQGSKGIRVYATRIERLADPADPPVTPYALALHGDPRVILDHHEAPIGYSIMSGPVAASESIAVGEIALLVVGRTYASGPDHDQRMDQAVARVGLERIHPLASPLPALQPRAVSMHDVSRLFTVQPVGADMSLMPGSLQSMMG